MTLNEYVKNINSHLDVIKIKILDFEKMWLNGNAYNPDFYPMEFESDAIEKWDEQFRLFYQGDNNGNF